MHDQESPVRHEARPTGDLFAVLDELHTNTFTDSRVGLFRLHADLQKAFSRYPCYRELPNATHFLQHDPLRVRTPSSWRSLVEFPESTLLVVLIRPSVLTARVAELSSSLKTAWLSGWAREKEVKQMG